MPWQVIDETGNRYGRLTVAWRGEDASGGQARWVCQCDCGGWALSRGDALRNGDTRSCGCLAREVSSRQLTKQLTTHGMSDTPTHQVWMNMKQRCTNPNNPKYPDYGGRGIEVHPRWLGKHGFANFLADVGERPPNPDDWSGKKAYWTLDRIDNDGNYEPGNVRWASTRDQNANTRLTRHCITCQCAVVYSQANGLETIERVA